MMREMTERLQQDPELAAAYRRAHESYLAERDAIESLGTTFTGGGMPDRVKCLHVVIAHSLAKGPGSNPFGDEALAVLAAEPAMAGILDAGGVDMSRVGAVDCGTNSIRLLIADPVDGRLRDVHREMRIVRLGQGVDATGEFAPEALARTGAALADYAALMREAPVSSGSGWSRRRRPGMSANRDEFFAMTAERAGRRGARRGRGGDHRHRGGRAVLSRRGRRTGSRRRAVRGGRPGWRLDGGGGGTRSTWRRVSRPTSAACGSPSGACTPIRPPPTRSPPHGMWCAMGWPRRSGRCPSTARAPGSGWPAP